MYYFRVDRGSISMDFVIVEIDQMKYEKEKKRGETIISTSITDAR